MFGNIPLITIFFRLLNFGVLILFFVYIFKRYFYQTISDQIAEKESFIQGLHQNNKVLEEQQHDLEMRITQQDNKCKELTGKILQWQHAVTEQQQKWQIIQEAAMREQGDRLRLQQATLEKDYLKEILLPHVLDQAETKLKQEFSSPQAGNAFIADIITQLHKGVQ